MAAAARWVVILLLAAHLGPTSLKSQSRGMDRKSVVVCLSVCGFQAVAGQDVVARRRE